MGYIFRQIEVSLRKTLARGKSVLLLGPRQTGKTTLVRQRLAPDISYTFARPDVKLRYEGRPGLLGKEIRATCLQRKDKPLVFIDEVQKIPFVMDTVQDLIDDGIAQFILSGSSARKLKHGANVNLLPGRVVLFIMDALSYPELPDPKPSLEELLLYGSLPGIVQQKSVADKDIDLISYVKTYLEEEIRAEALVRNVGDFSRFLELSASDSGAIINFSKLSQEIGVADTTIKSYYQILDDCMIAQRVDPIINSVSHRRLIKSPKYIFFDLGIRRACANEGARVSSRLIAHLFEQYVGIEILRLININLQNARLRYWRDSAGPEIDFVLDIEKQYVPIEVKWSKNPRDQDIKHLRKFISEYDNCQRGYVVCRTPHSFLLADNIIALPWQEIDKIF